MYVNLSGARGEARRVDNCLTGREGGEEEDDGGGDRGRMSGFSMSERLLGDSRISGLELTEKQTYHNQLEEEQ